MKKDENKDDLVDEQLSRRSDSDYKFRFVNNSRHVGFSLHIDDVEKGFKDLRQIIGDDLVKFIYKI